MIRCNLSVVLAERGLKITKVSQDTGISRTTLTSLCSNASQGIQFDTLNKLCLYLKINPEKLISFVPYQLTLLHTEVKDPTNFVFDIELDNGKVRKVYQLDGGITLKSESDPDPLAMVDLFSSADAPFNPILDAISQLPTPFFEDFRCILERSLAEEYMKKYSIADVSLVLNKEFF